MVSDATRSFTQRQLKARSRIEKACNTCRRRKEKCDGALPKCSNCTLSNRSCQYVHELKRRGLPEGYVHALEKCLAIGLLTHPEVSSSITAVLETGTDNPERGSFGALWTDEANECGLLKEWRSSQLARVLENRLPTLEQLQRRKIATNLDAQSELSSLRGVLQTTAATFTQQLSQLPEPRRNAIEGTAIAPDPVLLPSNALELIDDYFRFTHISLPIVEKHDIYRIYHRWDHGTTHEDLGHRACMLAILTLQGILNGARGSVSQDILGNLPTDELFSTHQPCSLGHIRALLIHGMVLAHMESYKLAWLYVGHALRSLTILRGSPNAGLTISRDDERRQLPSDAYQRVLTGCVILEVLLASVLGQQPLITTSMIGSIDSVDEDGIEEWESIEHSHESQGKRVRAPALALSTFNHLGRAVRVLYLELAVPPTQPSESIQSDEPILEPTTGSLAHQTTVSLLYRSIRLLKLLRGDYARSSSQTLFSNEIAVHTAEIEDLIRAGSSCDPCNVARLLWRVVLASLIKQVKQERLTLSDRQRSHILAVLEQQAQILQSHSSTAAPTSVGGAHHSTAPAEAEVGPSRTCRQAISSDLNNVLDTIDRAVGTSNAAPVRTAQHHVSRPDDTPWLGSIGDESSIGANIDDLFAMDAINWDSSWEQSFAGLGVPTGNQGTMDVYYDFSGAAP
jgi:hypothetical protein